MVVANTMLALYINSIFFPSIHSGLFSAEEVAKYKLNIYAERRVESFIYRGTPEEIEERVKAIITNIDQSVIDELVEMIKLEMLDGQL